MNLPKLYETVVVSPISEKHLESIDINSFLRGNSTSRLYHTKHVRISAPFHEHLDARCVHSEYIVINDQIRFDPDGDVDDVIDRGLTRFQKLATSAMELLKQLEDNTLKSFRLATISMTDSERANRSKFSWELGTCIPPQVLGPWGYLPVKQTSLEALTLITGSKCHYEDDGLLDLSQFRALRQISWIGLHSDSHFMDLQYALETNSKHLTHLRLEYVNQPDVSCFGDNHDTDDDDANSGDQGIYYRNYFAREALGLKRSAISLDDVMFPSLSSLSLGCVPLKNAEKALVHALNISGLRHLSLRQCPGMDNFLTEVAASGQILSLLSLEYTCGVGEYDICAALEGIFRIAPNLTSLFLLLIGPTSTLEFWRALAHSRLPITRFIYHQRWMSFDDKFRYYKEGDLSDLSLVPNDMDELEKAGEQHPFAQMNLECLGLGADPPHIVWQIRARFSL